MFSLTLSAESLILGNWLGVSFLRILSLLSLHLVTCFWTCINKSSKEASLREQPLTKEIYYSYLQLDIKFLWSSTCEDLKHHGRVSVKLVQFLLVKSSWALGRLQYNHTRSLRANPQTPEELFWSNKDNLYFKILPHISD
jgi:hypothetical protein